MSTSRPRTSGVPSAARQQQQPSQNFKPKSEWKHEDDASFLFVYLAGYVLEQFTITPNYSNRTVRVEGQRRLPNTRLQTVDETFSIPEGCELSKMDKQYERGALRLKMPRNIIVPQLVSQITVKETKEENPEHWETVGESMTRKDEETSPTELEKQNPDKVAISRPVTTAMEEKSAMADGKSEDKMVERKGENEGKQESVVQNDGVKAEENKAKIKEMKESATTSAMSVAKVEEKKEKEKSPKSADAEGKEAKRQNANASAKKGMVQDPNEDRKLLVNMGVAVLVIIGLGVYVFYICLKS